ncbi:MAG TPA: flagellar hook-associated protein FlgK [Caulobacteraceae bacterium]|nr:flagellar hook-associated protein FlgK [Caulobacteraceae bacterium]
MAINGIMNIALSAMQADQTGLTTVSNNITNENTPGYAREVVNLSPVVAGGAGAGVTANIQRVTNSYLESASYQANSAAGSASIIANLHNQAQTAFGDPSQSTSYLNQLSTVFTDFQSAANDPSSSLPRSQTLDDLSTFLSTSQNIAGTLDGLNTQADGQITSDVTQTNTLLSELNSLNSQINQTTSDGGDVSGLQDSQSQVLGQLSSLISINTQTLPNNQVVVRSSTGQLLVGYGGAATLSYTPSTTSLGVVTMTSPGSGQPTTVNVGDGEIQGLLTLRNSTIPGIQSELSNYVTGAVNAINAASNASSAVPPPQTLTGSNTGLDLPTIIGDFTGTTNIAIVDSSGNLQQQVQIDFTSDTMSVNGGAPTSFTPATFLSSLNTAFGGTATASFSNGALSLSATTAGQGIAVQDDATTPAQDGGQGFSQFFGLNNLITSNEITNYNTGLQATDANGFTPGGQMVLQMASSNGSPLGEVTVTVPPATQPTMQDLLNAMNSQVSQWGAFSLNSDGAMTFTPNSSGATVTVVSDDTQRGAGGPSISQLFGIGQAQQANAANSYAINPSIASNPMNMPLATLNLSAAASGEPVLDIGDGSGGTALANVANASLSFAAAGTMPPMTTTVTEYAAQLGGVIGQQSSAAQSASTAATSLQSAAQTQLQSVEGVNLDQELVNLTTYQQAYTASSRLVQASKDMIDTLLDMVN